jgi:hypothetical protein
MLPLDGLRRQSRPTRRNPPAAGPPAPSQERAERGRQLALPLAEGWPEDRPVLLAGGQYRLPISVRRVARTPPPRVTPRGDPSRKAKGRPRPKQLALPLDTSPAPRTSSASSATLAGSSAGPAGSVAVSTRRTSPESATPARAGRRSAVCGRCGRVSTRFRWKASPDVPGHRSPPPNRHPPRDPARRRFSGQCSSRCRYSSPLSAHRGRRQPQHPRHRGDHLPRPRGPHHPRQQRRCPRVGALAARQPRSRRRPVDVRRAQHLRLRPTATLLAVPAVLVVAPAAPPARRRKPAGPR